jgi:hypothetical protein
MAIRRYPGQNQDLVQQLLQLKNQAAITGQVNPDYAPIVQASLADTRDANYKDFMLGLQEQGQALAEKKQASQEVQANQLLSQKGQQFSESLAMEKQNMADQIAAANRARTMGYINTGLGAGLAGAYLYGYDPSKRRLF